MECRVAHKARKTARDRILQTVAERMVALDVSGLPRNYELFHEAMSGSDSALTRDVLALPVSPPQVMLDEIGLRHQLAGFIAVATPRSRDQEVRLLSELRDKVANGVEQKQGFGQVLESVARSLREDENALPGDILAEIEYLSVSLSDAVVAEAELEATLKTGVDRLARAERDCSAARAVTMRDRMTSLPNHAALSERLEMLYGSNGDDNSATLFIVTINDLPDLAQSYGEPVANRIVKKAAWIFQKAIKKNDFVARIGKYEFAFLLRDVGRDSIQAIAERLNASVAGNLALPSPEKGGVIDLSIGASLVTDAFSPHQLRIQAAAALQEAQSVSGFKVAIHSGNLRTS